MQLTLPPMAPLKVDGCNADTAAMNLTYPKLGRALKAAAEKAGKAGHGL
jgi:hypothetical protein